MTQQPFPVHVHTGWIDFSPVVHSYATRRVTLVLGTFASRIRSVTVRIAAHEPHDPASRLCAIDLQLKPAGTISTVSTGGNVYDVVNHATEAILGKVRRQFEAEGTPQRSRRCA